MFLDINIAGFDITVENVSLIFSCLFGLFLLLNGILGFLRGTRKSIVYLIATCLVFALGFIFMDKAIDALMNLKIGGYVAQFVQGFYPSVTDASTTKDIIIGAIINFVPAVAGAIEEGTIAIGLLVGLAKLVLKLVYLIVLFVFAFVIFKLIVDIIWLIIKPKKKKGKKVRKGFLSRLGGLGIGATKGVFYALLLFTIIAGIISTLSSIGDLSDAVIPEETAVIVLTNDEATLVRVAQEYNGMLDPEELQYYLSLLDSYRLSIPGKLYDAIKIETVPIDEFFFDGVFSFDVQTSDEEVISIKLRKEIQTVAKAFSEVITKLDIQNISLDTIISLKDEDAECLKGVFDVLGDLDILKVAIPATLEIALYGDVSLGEGQGSLSDMLSGIITGDDIQTISNGLIGDISTIGYTLIDARSLIGNIVGESVEDINTYLNLDANLVKTIFDEDHLGGLNSIDILAPIGLVYLQTVESVKITFEEFGLEIESLTTLGEGDSWKDEIANIGSIYVAAQDLLKDPVTGVVALDQDNILSIFSTFTEEKVNNFVETVFASSLVSNSSTALIKYTKDNVLSAVIVGDSNMSEYINISENYKFDANECKAFLNAASTIINSGIINSDNIQQAFADLSDEQIDDMARHLSSSELIRTSLSTSMDLLFSVLTSDDFALRYGDFTIINENDEVVSGWTDIDATKKELSSVLKAGRIVVGMLAGEGGISLETFAGFSEEDILVVLDSKIMTGTLINFLEDNATSDNETLAILATGVDSMKDNPNGWYDQNSIDKEYTIVDTTMTIEATLDDVAKGVNKYLIYADGKLLTSIRFNPGDDVSIDLSSIVISIDEEDVKTYFGFDNETLFKAVGIKEGELHKIFLAIGSVIDAIGDSNSGFDLSSISKLTDEDIDNIVLSDVLCATIASVIIDLDKDYNPEKGTDYISVPKNLVYTVDGKNHPVIKDNEGRQAGWAGNNGELYSLFRGAKSLLSSLGDGASLDNLNYETLISMNDETIDDVLESDVLTLSMIKLIENASNEENSFIAIPDVHNLKAESQVEKIAAWGNVDSNKGELANIFAGLKAIVGDKELNFESIDANTLISIDDSAVDTLVESDVLVFSLVKQITKLSTGADPFIVIPEGSLTSTNDLEKLQAWGNTKVGNLTTEGELSHLVKALKAIVSGIAGDGSLNLDSIDVEQVINMSDENIDKVMLSKVLVLSMITKIETMAGEDSFLDIPDVHDLKSSTQSLKISAWSGNNEEDGELEKIFKSLRTLSSKTSGSYENIDANTLLDLDDEDINNLLISDVVTFSLVKQITKLSTGADPFIVIPDGSLTSTNDLEKLQAWGNTKVGDLTTEGELSILLHGLKSIASGTSIDNISTSTLVNMEESKIEGICYSQVLVLSIASKLENLSNETGSFLVIPKGDLQNSNEDIKLSAWMSDKETNTQGELAKFFKAASALLAGNDDFNNIDFNVKSILDKSNCIFSSSVISESVISKIINIGTFDIPNGVWYYDELNNPISFNLNDEYDRSSWVMISGEECEGELIDLLKALSVVMGDNVDITSGSTNFSLESMFSSDDKVQALLKSKILSETFATKIFESGAFDIPEYYLNSKSFVTSTRDIDYQVLDGMLQWKYNEDSVWLDLIECEKANGAYTKLEVAEDISGLVYRNSWYNRYNASGIVSYEGELSKILGSLKALLANGDGTYASFDSFSISDLSNVLTCDSDELLRSIIVSETVVNKITGAITSDIPETSVFTNTRFDSDVNRSAWYNEYNIDGTIKHRHELSKLLGAIQIIFGNDVAFDRFNDVSLDMVLAIDVGTISYIEEGINEEDFRIEGLEKIISSEVIESLISPTVQSAFTAFNSSCTVEYLIDLDEDGIREEPMMYWSLSDLIDASFATIDEDYNIVYSGSGRNAYDLLTFMESFYYMKKQGNLSYGDFASLATNPEVETTEVARAFTHTRSFRANISNLFGSFITVYNIVNTPVTQNNFGWYNYSETCYYIPEYQSSESSTVISFKDCASKLYNVLDYVLNLSL